MEKIKPKYDFASVLTPYVPEVSVSSAGHDHSFLSLPQNSSSVRQRTRKPTVTPYKNSCSSRPQSSTLLSSIVTPGTPGLQSANIIALVEGRGRARGEIGMASIDLKNPVLVLSQFPDSQTYVKVMTKLEVLSPIEILMPSTACEGGAATKLFTMITNFCPHVNLATVQRKYFNESKGIQMIRQLVVSEYSSVELELAAKYYCLAAAAALLKYVELIQNVVYASNSLKVVFRGSEQTMMIDISTVKNLELITNIRDPKSPYTLFGILNYTNTQQGARLLRSNILQPPCDLETIMLRHNCVQEFIDNEDMFFGLESVLKRFIDLDHIMSLLVQVPKQDSVKTADNKITLVICVKHCLELVDSLKEIISTSENPLLMTFHEVHVHILSDVVFNDLIVKIQEVIHEDAHYQKGTLNMRAQKCFAVKPNLNGYLDVARRTYSETIDDIIEMVSQLGEKEGLVLKTNYNNTRGFYIQITCDNKGQEMNISDLPQVFIKAVKAKNAINCTTADLIKMNDRCSESLNEIYLVTNMVMGQLLEQLRKSIGCLYKLSECVAMLDLLLSLAHVCTVSNFTVPEFTDTLAIKQGYHPILQKVAYDSPVPNNIYASTENNFIIITGPNMSGKSTYLKQIALLQIMAQIGCFVPAEYASFRLARQVFSRIGSDNDIETNASTFTVEMREINYILQNLSGDSLIIIDELGRGTSSEEGVGLCHAICEKLIASKAFTFFATHFLELTHLEALYPNVENYHFEIKSTKRDDTLSINFTHHLLKGETEERHYGLCLASMSTLPQCIIDVAVQVAKEIQQKKVSNEDQTKTKEFREHYTLATRLVQIARSSQLDRASLFDLMRHLKDQYMKQNKLL